MTTKLPPSRTAEQFVVRFPEGMRARIAEIAKKNGRSMNAEIVHRLAWSLEANDFYETPDPETGVVPAQPVADTRTKSWAEYMALPENRKDLESMLAVVRTILQRSGAKLAPDDKD